MQLQPAWPDLSFGLVACDELKKRFLAFDRQEIASLRQELFQALLQS